MAGRPRITTHPSDSGEAFRSAVHAASWKRLVDIIFGNGRCKGRYDSLRRFALRNMSRRLRSEADPDEILHEVCISAHEDFAQLPDDARLEPWIKKAILNRIRNRARKQGRQKRIPPGGSVRIRLEPDGQEGSPWLLVPSHQPAPEEVVAFQEEIERISEKVGLLPLRQSTLIDLVHFREMPLSWAAALLGMTDVRASRLLFEGLQAIRELHEVDDHGCRGDRRSSEERKSRKRRPAMSGVTESRL
jgi:RNA polymerase sigma factor (sigma-70 family)